MGIMFGVVAALCWGIGDFLITHLTRRIGTPRALISIQILSLLAWVLLWFTRPTPLEGTPFLWMMVLGTAVCHVLGLFFVYRAFEIGTVSIVSPISAGFAVITALLAFGTGERPPAMAVAGAVLLIAGVTVATRPPAGPASGRVSWTGVPEAILSALAFGTMFWLFYFFVQPKLGYAWPLILLKTLAVGTTLLMHFSRRQRDASTRPFLGLGTVALAAGAAAADTLAWLAYIGGTATSYATVVTALASLFSVVTALLAWRFLRERLALHQWAGVGTILLGILLVSV